jgi:hypothetical protein
MQKYFNNVVNRTGDVVVGALVTVTNTATGALAQLFIDDGITPGPNPVVTDNNGLFEFYVDFGRYSLTISGGGVGTLTIPDISLEDASVEAADAAASASAAAASAAAAAAATVFVQAGTGAITRTTQNKSREIISVTDFAGVDPTGATDSTAGIDAAIVASLGRSLFFPKGTYRTNGISVTSLTGVHITGEDKYSTIIQLNNAQNTHVVSYTGAVDCSLENVTLNQNTANQTGGHGIRMGGVDGLTIRNVIIKECNDYGIGIQAGTNTNVLIDGFEINGTGIDGIDVKDSDLANENITITNGVIRDFGREGSASGGFDIRGPVIVSNIHVVCQNANGRGFRFRIESVQGRAGSGSASNISVLLSDTTQQGFNLEGATNNNVALTNITVRGGALGIVGSTGCLLKNLTSYGATASEALSIPGSDNIIDGLVIDGATRGIDMEPAATGNIITNFNIKNVTGADAVRIQATANNNSFTQGVVQSGKNIADAATGTTIRDVRNWATKANLISTDLLVDSTGSKAFTFTHGLAVTPNPEDVTLTVIRSTGSPTDYRIGLIHIDGNPTSTTFAGRIVVTSASATGGAAVRLAATVRSKNA